MLLQIYSSVLLFTNPLFGRIPPTLKAQHTFNMSQPAKRQRTVQALSKASIDLQSSASMIRAMFEEGARLKKLHGADNVFDFSLGNPIIEPPEAFNEAMKDAVLNAPPGSHSYMTNVGFLETRKAVAESLKKLWHLDIGPQHLAMTIGAAGAICTILKTILDPADEVILLTPFFVEYVNYIKTFNAKEIRVSTTESFDIDVPAIKAALTDKTRVVLMCSPNNPTGRVYSKESVAALGKLLTEENDKRDRPIYLVNDQVYGRLTFDDVKVEPLFPHSEFSIIAGSYSKDMSLAGERIGYIAVNPNCNHAQELMDAFAITTRVLGYVNAPATLQRALAKCCEEVVDLNWYKSRRDLMYQGLVDAGLECVKPEGGFFLFPKVPAGVSDDDFFDELKKRNVLTVPGRAFGKPGYFRISYACTYETCVKSLPFFKEAVDAVKRK